MVRLCFVFYINIIKVVSLLSFPGIDMRRSGTETRERFPYERAPTDAQKGRRKQGKNRRKTKERRF